MKMARTCVCVKDSEASLDSYQKAFSFKENRRRGFPESKFILVYLTLPGDDYELELTYNYDHEAYGLGNDYGYIAISTDDLKGLHERHQATGLTVTDLKGLPRAAPSYYFVINPDGYKIRVIRGR